MHLEVFKYSSRESAYLPIWDRRSQVNNTHSSLPFYFKGEGSRSRVNNNNTHTHTHSGIVHAISSVALASGRHGREGSVRIDSDPTITFGNRGIFVSSLPAAVTAGKEPMGIEPGTHGVQSMRSTAMARGLPKMGADLNVY